MRNIFWAVAIVFMVMVTAASAQADTPKGNPGNPPANVAKTYVPEGTATTGAGTATTGAGTTTGVGTATTATTTSTSAQIAWVRYGPISVDPYRSKDWYVSYGGSLGGTPVTVVSLSIPWSGNGIGHRYSINTESNYMYNNGAWVQVSSGDDFGIPTGTIINLIGIY